MASLDLAAVPDRRAGARPVVAGLFTLTVIAMFTLSGGVLWSLGLNYNGLTGAMASKIHPATYAAILSFVALVLARRNPAAFGPVAITRHPGALAFLLAALALGLVIVLDGRRGIATIFDTYVLAALVAMVVAELDERARSRLEALLHLMLAANAALAIGEYFLGHRLFPYRFEGTTFDWDTRSTALIGHPLENALITGSYLMILLAGGGSGLPRLLRLPAILLQLAALIPFGGRTALLMTMAMLAFTGLNQLLALLRGARMSLPALALAAASLPLVVLAIGAIAAGGFFDLIAERFISDGGSARARLQMLDLIGRLSLRDLLMGSQSAFVDAARRSQGLELGIENPLVRLVVYQGAILTGLLMVGLALFLIEVGRRLRPGAAMAFVFFLVVANSFESIANKTLVLAQFVLLLAVLLRRPTSP
jgi:hypothetical protein